MNQLTDRYFTVRRFSGVVRHDGETRLAGDAAPFKSLPARIVRRLSNLEKGVASCLVGLGEDVGDAPIVLASRYGAMGNTLKLLKGLVAGDVMSPTGFSLSVHNAAVGVASQLAGNHGGHTAVSAGEGTLNAGVLECFCRLTEGAETVVLLYSDCQLTDEYGHFETVDSDIQFACLLALTDAPPEDCISVDAGSASVIAALESGAGGLVWTA